MGTAQVPPLEVVPQGFCPYPNLGRLWGVLCWARSLPTSLYSIPLGQLLDTVTLSSGTFSLTLWHTSIFGVTWNQGETALLCQRIQKSSEVYIRNWQPAAPDLLLFPSGAGGGSSSVSPAMPFAATRLSRGMTAASSLQISKHFCQPFLW